MYYNRSSCVCFHKACSWTAHPPRLSGSMQASKTCALHVPAEEFLGAEVVTAQQGRQAAFQAEAAPQVEVVLHAGAVPQAEPVSQAEVLLHAEAAPQAEISPGSDRSLAAECNKASIYRYAVFMTQLFRRVILPAFTEDCWELPQYLC